MRLVDKKFNIEGGQALILFTLMLCALLLCAMAVVDVGFFLHNRENAQQTADAAALAGAQDLPGSTANAQTDALAYVTKNGLSTANTTVTFSCTSQTVSVCTTGSGTYDTIVVTQKAPSPTYFGGILSILGFNNCWVTGCTATASAAGCRGACGGQVSDPLDVVVVMDRTGSMSATDLTNAKNGAKALLQAFNPSLQHVALGVLGPSSTSSTCGSPNSGGKGIATSSGGTWIPVPLSSDYQNANGTLNTSSLIVKTINCLDFSSVGTDLGDPMQAAMQYLQANGRVGVKHVIIFETDGAANIAPTITTSVPHNTVTPDDTTFLDCTTSGSTAPVTSSSGDNDGYQTSESNACNPDNNYASDGTSSNGSGNNSGQTSCPDTTGSSSNNGGSGANGKDKHVFANYPITLPASPTVTGITVRIDGKVSSTSGTRMYCVQVSRDGGLTYSAAKSTTISSTSEQQYNFGSATDLWGFSSWTATQLNNSNFRVRVTDVANDTSRIFYIDDIRVKVDYTTVVTTYTNVTTWDGSHGPCDWANIQATAAKAAGITIFTIGFGVEGDTCVEEDSTSSWDGDLATSLLASMATNSTDDGGDGSGGIGVGCDTTAEQNSENADGDHFLCEARSADLTPIFQSAAQSLANGSKLVQ